MKKFLLAIALLSATWIPATAQNTLAGNLTVQQTIKYTGAQTPTQITSNQNDYAPTNIGIASALRISSDQANRTITGLVPGTSPGGRLMWLLNIGSYPIVFSNESGSSVAANRFALGEDYSLPAGNGLALWYDATSSRWRAQTNLTALELGTVESVSVVTANGVSGSVATPTTTPAITLTLGAITPSSVAASGTVTGSNLSGTNTGDQTTVTGNAGTATALQTARNINGVAFDGTQNITVTAAAGTLTGTTLASNVVNSSLLNAAGGTFGTAAFTPTTNYATAAQGATADTAVQPTRSISTTSPLTGGGDLSANRTFAINDAAADGTTKGAATFTAADFNASSGLLSLDYANGQSASGSTKGFLTSADWTTFNSKQPAGSYVVVGGALGTPSSGTLTNATGLPVSTGIGGLGTGVATALAVNVGTAGAPVINGGALGTPSSGTVTNLTGTASININGTVGATTPNTVAATSVTVDGVTLDQYGTSSGLLVSAPSSAADARIRLENGAPASTGNFAQLDLAMNTTTTARTAGTVVAVFTDITDATRTSELRFSNALSGALTTRMTLTGTGLNSTAIGATTPSTGRFTQVGIGAAPDATRPLRIVGVDGVVGSPPTYGAKAGIIYENNNNASISVTSSSGGYPEINFYRSGTAAPVANWYSEPGTNTLIGAVTGTESFKLTPTGINSTPIGATTPSTGAFTTLGATGNIYSGNNSFNVASGTTDGFYVQPSGQVVNSINADVAWYLRRRTSDGSSIQFYRDTSQVGSISVTTTTTAFNTSSDRRLKTNIRDFTLSGPIIDRIKPRIYDWKTGEKNTIGFVAQELYEVYPAAVSKGDDNLVKIKDQWAVDYSKLVPVLVAEIQSLRARVEELEKNKSSTVIIKK